MKTRLTFPQILLSAAVIATIMTVADSFIEWEKKIYGGIFAFVIVLSVCKIVEVLFKGQSLEESNEPVKE